MGAGDLNSGPLGSMQALYCLSCLPAPDYNLKIKYHSFEAVVMAIASDVYVAFYQLIAVSCM